MKLICYFLITLFFPFLTVAQLEYDNKLSVTWPPGFCVNPKDCKPQAKNQKYFSVHGLWPETPEGPECMGNPDDCVTLMSTLKQQDPTLPRRMDVVWPKLGPGGDKSNVPLWSHEWRTHGVCTVPLMSLGEYFKRTVALFDKELPTTTLSMLKSAGIIPGEYYSEQELLDNLNLKLLKFKPEIACNRVGDGATLSEVRFCVNPEGTEIKSCDAARLMGCGGTPSGIIEFKK